MNIKYTHFVNEGSSERTWIYLCHVQYWTKEMLDSFSLRKDLNIKLHEIPLCWCFQLLWYKFSLHNWPLNEMTANCIENVIQAFMKLFEELYSLMKENFEQNTEIIHEFGVSCQLKCNWNRNEMNFVLFRESTVFHAIQSCWLHISIISYSLQFIKITYHKQSRFSNHRCSCSIFDELLCAFDAINQCLMEIRSFIKDFELFRIDYEWILHCPLLPINSDSIRYDLMRFNQSNLKTTSLCYLW